MAIQTVVIDISKTDTKMKSFEKHVDRLGKSFEKLQRQMERLSYDKRSMGLSQGDTLSKSIEKMTDTMTRLFSNGIKINNPNVNAKVTVDFSKMGIAGQMGKIFGNISGNADIAGTIIRNLPRAKMTMPEIKIAMPNKIEAEITNKEIQVKLPKDFLNGGEKEKKQGFLTRKREKFDEMRGKYITNDYKKNVKPNFQKNIEKNKVGIIDEKNTSNFKDFYLPSKVKRNLELKVKQIAERDLELKTKPMFKERNNGRYKRIEARRDNIKEGYINKHSTKYIKGSFEKGIEEKTGNFVKNLNFMGRVIPDSFNSLKSLPRIFGGIKSVFSGLSFGGKIAASAGGIGAGIFGIASLELKAFAFTVKAVAGVIGAVVGVFKKIADIASAVWGQAQKWIFNPMVQTQNQISENKGYKMLLGGDKQATDFDNSIFEMSEKSPFSHEAIDSGARMFLANGVGADETKNRLSLIQDTAAAFSLDDSGFQNIVTTISQLGAKKNIYIEDITQGLGNTIPTMQLITDGINQGANGVKKSVEQVKEEIENGDYTGSQLLENLLQGMEQYGGTADEIANTTFMGLKTKLSNIFQSNFGKNWGKGLSDGFTGGFSKIASFMDSHKDTFEKWGASLRKMGEQVGTTISGILEGLMERFNKVVSSDKFDSLDLSGKIVLLWDKVIKEPLANWWNSTGRSFMGSLFFGAGNGIGEILTGVACGFMNSNPATIVTEGTTLGLKLAAGIIEGLDKGAIFEGLVGLVGNIVVAPFESLKNLWDDFRNHVKKSEESQSSGLSSYKKPAKDIDENPVIREQLQKKYFGEGEVTAIDFTNGKEVKEFTDSEKWGAEAIGGYLQKDMQPLLEESEKYKNAVAKKNTLGDFHDKAEAISKMAEGEEKESAIDTLNEDMKTSGFSELEGFQFAGTANDVDFLAGKEASSQNAVDKSKRILEEGLNDDTTQKYLDSTKKYAQHAKEISDWKEKRLSGFQSEKEGFMDSIAKYEEELGFVENTDLSQDERDKHAGKMDEIIIALNRRLKAYGVSEDDLFSTGMEPEAMKALIEKTEGDFGKEATDAKTFFEEIVKGLVDYANVTNSLNMGIAETGMGMSIQEAFQNQEILNGTSPFANLFTQALQQADQLNQDMTGLVEPAHKEIIIEVLYKQIGVPPVYGISTNTITTTPSSNEPPKDDINTGDVMNNAKGNILMSPHLSWVAEAGPEAIIPLTGPYKKRGISLWEQAGQMLGVTPKYGKGGIVGSYEIPKETPQLYQQIEQSSEETENTGGSLARIDMGGVYLGGVNFTFNGTEANSREGIMNVIKEQMPDIADEIAGTIAVNIQKIFANMKLQTS